MFQFQEIVQNSCVALPIIKLLQTLPTVACAAMRTPIKADGISNVIEETV